MERQRKMTETRKVKETVGKKGKKIDTSGAEKATRMQQNRTTSIQMDAIPHQRPLLDEMCTALKNGTGAYLILKKKRKIYCFALHIHQISGDRRPGQTDIYLCRLTSWIS